MGKTKKRQPKRMREPKESPGERSMREAMQVKAARTFVETRRQDAEHEARAPHDGQPGLLDRHPGTRLSDSASRSRQGM